MRGYRRAMLRKNIFRLVGLLAFAGVSWATACAEEPLFADSPTDMQAATVKVAEEALVAPAPIPELLFAPDPDTDDVYVIRLGQYLADDIIENWTPAVKQVPSVPPGEVAWDIARAVVHEPEDPGHCATVTGADGRKRCLWAAPGWNSDHAKAVLVAAVGYWEGARYAADVDNLNCNSADWRKDPANAPLIHIMGNCDGGRAWSIFQVWPRVGSAHESPINESCSKDAVAVRYTAARCALQILRMSMMAKGDLTGYTGETQPRGETGDERPMIGAGETSWKQKATVRLEFARKALKKHPFPSP
jgi:hypothetical protein